MEVLIYLSSVCTGLTLIKQNAIKDSGVFSHKMFRFPQVKNGDKMIIKTSLTVLGLCSHTRKVNPEFSFDP